MTVNYFMWVNAMFKTFSQANNAAFDMVGAGLTSKAYIYKDARGFIVTKSKSKTRTNLVHVVDKEDYRQATIAKNPAPKRKTSARTQSAAESYVRRKSQATGKAPSKRLVNRRIKNLQAPEGVFPNPSVRNKKFIFVKKAFVNSPNRFSCVAYFHDTPEGNKNAIEYAKAYHRQNPEFIIKVETGTM